MGMLTVRVSDKLRKRMKRLRHVNWSDVVRRAIEERAEFEERVSGRDEAAIREATRRMDALFEEVRRRYGHLEFNSAETIRYWRDHRYGPLSRTPQ